MVTESERERAGKNKIKISNLPPQLLMYTCTCTSFYSKKSLTCHFILSLPTCRWNSNSRSALSSIIALRKAGSGRTPPGMDSKSVIRWAILALILRITCTCTWEGERWGLVIHCMASCICTQFFDTLYGFVYMHMRGRKEEKGFYDTLYEKGKYMASCICTSWCSMYTFLSLSLLTLLLFPLI